LEEIAKPANVLDRIRIVQAVIFDGALNELGARGLSSSRPSAASRVMLSLLPGREDDGVHDGRRQK